MISKSRRCKTSISHHPSLPPSLASSLLLCSVRAAIHGGTAHSAVAMDGIVPAILVPVNGAFRILAQTVLGVRPSVRGPSAYSGSFPLSPPH